MSVDVLEGGIRKQLKLDDDYPPIDDSEEEFMREERCLTVTEKERLLWELPDKQCSALTGDCYLLYFPYTYNTMTAVPTKYGQYLWQLYCSNVIQDQQYIKVIKSVLFQSISRLNQGTKLNELSFNHTFVNLNWLPHCSRRSILYTLAVILRSQTRLSYISFENARLDAENGLRILLSSSLGAGKTIRQASLWLLFRNDIRPFTSGRNRFKEDSTIYTNNDETISEEVKEKIWNELLMNKRVEIPQNDYYNMYIVALSCFETLAILHINYSWISIGQGDALCQLGSVRNGCLRELHLLCIPTDIPEYTTQSVSSQAWKQALSMCPKLKVHLVILDVPNSKQNRQFLNEDMPLETFHLSTGYPHYEKNKSILWSFDCALRDLIRKYQTSLRALSLEVWHPRQFLDSILCKCLTKFYYLNNFEYSGPIDKLDTIHEICDFLLKYSTRISQMRLNILEDTSNSQAYRTCVDKIRMKYETKMEIKGIVFILQTVTM